MLDYAAQPERAVIVAPDSAERKVLNRFIRSDLQSQGRIVSENHSVPILIERHYLNPKLAESYAPGDKIHYETGIPVIPYCSNTFIMPQ